MARDPREWSIPAPVRALMWWPAASFVLVIVAPEAAVGSIMLAGAALALFGGLLSTLARRIRRTATVIPHELPATETSVGDVQPVDVPSPGKVA
ncbi:hypothetical protein [Pseudonocardia sp. TRM90224]|uniref:hypothetical protein n=1 Tax=Pseudonocardia sp. TRM90224 TaxID=2812678 RepID=UPI001E5777D5|nr:hypothetical protein [Pseudonocardia sp. TRM90224]